MPIIGINFKSIEAKIEDKRPDGNIDINSTPSVEDIKEKDLNVPGLKDVLAVEFKFVTKYQPDVGEIKICGEVLYQTEDAKKILDMWEEKKLESKVAVDVLNTIFKKCLTKAVAIADELNLPPPLTFPLVKSGPAPTKETREKKTTG